MPRAVESSKSGFGDFPKNVTTRKANFKPYDGLTVGPSNAFASITIARQNATTTRRFHESLHGSIPEVNLPSNLIHP
jgi:hypothetical protein